MKKVVIVTYYWPPMGGGGVQRWLKFSKYLREYGWEPIIYTPSNADIANSDISLLKDVPKDITVLKTEIWEPFNLYKKVIGKSKDEKIQPGFLQESDSNAFLQKISVWIRGNLFIPDAKKFWIKPSIKYLKEYIRKNEVDAIITTGPPHSNHLIGLGLKKSTGVKWLADFRDPWTNIDYYEKLKLTNWANKRHHSLEKQVLKMADEVVTVSWSWAEDFERISGERPVVITNGYDPDDFKEVSSNVKNNKVTITHIGSLNADRNPHAFWVALSVLKEKDIINKDNFIVRFIGPTDISAFNAVSEFDLKEVVEHVNHLPHKEVLRHLVESDILLLPLNDTPNISGVIPGKLYEYLASRRPILCIGKIDGDSSKIILDSKSGESFDFKDSKGIQAYLRVKMEQFSSGNIPVNQASPDKFSRKVLAGKIADELNNILSKD